MNRCLFSTKEKDFEQDLQLLYHRDFGQTPLFINKMQEPAPLKA